MTLIREPAVSGTFYPSNPRVLREDIKQYLNLVPADLIAGTTKGLISPHAGYMYSGQVAAYGYKTLAGGRYDTVIIIAPSHKSSFHGVSVQESGAYKTPLGMMAIDEEAAEAILKAGKVVHSDPGPHKEEHAIEVQLPFLQVTLGNVRILPLIMGEQTIRLCEELTDQIVTGFDELNRSVLIVGSTDLSHYFSYSRAVQLDSVITGRLAAFDPEGLEKEISANRAEACGAGPMIATMLSARKLGADRAAVLKYANSGDISGDRSAVVGYVSCAFFTNEKTL